MEKKPEKAYLVTRKDTGEKRLVDASAPANAIAYCAKDDYQAQRLEGPALEVVLTTMELESASSRSGDQSEPSEPSENVEVATPEK